MNAPFLDLTAMLACQHKTSSVTVFRLNDDCPECRAFNQMKAQEIARRAFSTSSVSIESLCRLPEAAGHDEIVEREEREQDYPGGMQA